MVLPAAYVGCSDISKFVLTSARRHVVRGVGCSVFARACAGKRAVVAAAFPVAVTVGANAFGSDIGAAAAVIARFISRL
jgi:hypothetical protein